MEKNKASPFKVTQVDTKDSINALIATLCFLLYLKDKAIIINLHWWAYNVLKQDNNSRVQRRGEGQRYMGANFSYNSETNWH